MGAQGNKFEDNLKLLLTRAYEVPEYRAEFRTELFGKLRDSQRARAAGRRRSPGNGPFLFGALSGLAAAALVVLVLAPILARVPGGARASRTDIGSGSDVLAAAGPGLSQTGSNPAGESPLPGIGVDSRLASLTAASAPESDRPLSRPPAPSEAVLVASGAQAGQAHRGALAYDAMEIRGKGNPAWAAMDEMRVFELKPGIQLRTPDGAREPIGIWLDEGTKLVLRPGSMVSNREDGLHLENGVALLTIDGRHEPGMMHLPGHSVRVEPGSAVCLKVEAGPRFAEHGAPAPVVVVLSGGAALQAGGEAAEQALICGRVYELYETVTGRIPSRDLHELERKHMNRSVIPAGDVRLGP